MVGGWVVGGWFVGGVKLKLKLNSAQLKLELGLSLAIIKQETLQFKLQLSRFSVGYLYFILLYQAKMIFNIDHLNKQVNGIYTSGIQL